MMVGGGRGFQHALRSEQRKAEDVWVTLKRMTGYLKPFVGSLFIAGVLIIGETLLAVAAPRLIGSGVDTVWGFIQGDATISAAGAVLARTMLFLLVVYVANWLVRSGGSLIMVHVGQTFLYYLRRDIFEKVQALSLKFFDRHETGDIMSRQTNDTEVINRVLSHGILRFVSSIFTIVGIVISMMMLNWRLALVSFTILPVMFVSTVYFSGRARKAFRKTRKTIGKVSAELEENIA